MTPQQKAIRIDRCHRALALLEDGDLGVDERILVVEPSSKMAGLPISKTCPNPYTRSEELNCRWLDQFKKEQKIKAPIQSTKAHLFIIENG